jgi:fructokinase
VGSSPHDLEEVTTIPTTTPDETLRQVIEFFARHPAVAAVGIGSFGPVDLHKSSPRYGMITTTPKVGWSNTDIAGFLGTHLKVPVEIDTDVNAAALGEGRWGAGRGFETFCYVTVGTGVGGGVVVHGQLLHGLVHPEFGHMRIPHDRARDPFPGICPYHGDCLEGLASGEALRARLGETSTRSLDDQTLALEAEYVGLGLVNVLATLSPQRIILGGGVMNEPGLLPLVRQQLSKLAGGYFDAPELSTSGVDGFVVPPALAGLSGVLGALELARNAQLTGGGRGRRK